MVTEPGLLKWLLVDELSRKTGAQGWWTPVVGLVKSPGLLLARLLPWSVVGLLGVGHLLIHWRGWRAWVLHPVWPALWWSAVVVLFFVPAADRGDFLGPAIPSVAVLAAWWVGHHTAGLRTSAWVAGAVGCVGLALVAWRVGIAEPYGANAHGFAAQVREVVGEERVVMIDTGYNPVPALLGVHQHGKGPGGAWDGWLIAPVEGAGRGVEPVVVSGLISEVEGGRAAALGLYRVGGEGE